MTNYQRLPLIRLLWLPCSLYLITSCFFSCRTKQEVSLQELKAYTLDPKNGLYKKDEAGDVLVELIYRPKDIIIEQNAGTENNALWDSTAQQLKAYDYFVLRISKENKEIETYFAGDPGRYTSLVNYLSGGISTDIKIVSGDEEFGVSDAVFAPAYGMSDASSILLVFESDLQTSKNDFTVIFEDSQLGTGRHEFHFDYRAIENTPWLKR